MFRIGVRLPSVVASGRSRRFPIVPVVSIALGRCVGLVSSARRPMFSLQIGCRDVHGITHTNHTGCVCMYVCICTCTCVGVGTHTCTCTCTCTHVRMVVKVPESECAPHPYRMCSETAMSLWSFGLASSSLLGTLPYWTNPTLSTSTYSSIHTYVCPHVPMYVHAQMYIPTICYVQTYHVSHWFGWYGGWCCGMTRKTKRGTTAGYRHVETDRVSHDCFGI